MAAFGPDYGAPGRQTSEANCIQVRASILSLLEIPPEPSLHLWRDNLTNFAPLLFR
jgi:hypothetical protein